MNKQIEKVETFIPEKHGPGRMIIVVTVKDGVRYVFEDSRILDDEYEVVAQKVEFSHRFYPTRKPGQQRVDTNYKLPKTVEEYITLNYREPEMMPGMIAEAYKNKYAVKKLNNEQNYTTA